MVSGVTPDPDELAENGLDLGSERLRAWLRRIVQGRVAAYGERVGADVLELMVEWLCARPERFLRWQDLPEYRGDDYACGYWKLEEGALHRALWEAMQDAQAQRESADYPTLEEWLAALHGGRLVREAPEEQNATRLVRHPSRRVPRCRDCGEPFTFHPKHPGAKRCERCREVKWATRRCREWGGRTLATLLARAGFRGPEQVADGLTGRGGVALSTQEAAAHAVVANAVRDLLNGKTSRLYAYRARLAELLRAPSADAVEALFQPRAEWPQEVVTWLLEAGLIPEEGPHAS